MRGTKKVAVVILILIAFMAASTKAMADEGMQGTMKDAVYGGVIGALVGGAVTLLTNHPGDHLGYIATGAGFGIIGGTAYGLATNSGLVRTSAVGEINDGKLTLRMPTIKIENNYEAKTDSHERLRSIDLLRMIF